MLLLRCSLPLFVLLAVNTISSEKVTKSNDENEDSEWMVYEPAHFDKNELCMVLICQQEELCVVNSNNAVCSIADRLDDIQGKKHFYKSNETSAPLNNKKSGESAVVVDYKNAVDDGEWDQNKLRNKMLKHLSKLADKKSKKAKNSLKNEVYHEPSKSTVEPLESHERHGSKMGPYRNCTLRELNSIKGRLFKWFADIHAVQKTESSYELPKHEVSCQEDVGFMFFILDGDKDEKLSVDELFSIDNDPYEKCVKSFLDRCDSDSNDHLSINEWCDCFHWADDERHEPACHVALRKHDPHDPDSFFPNCDVDGHYKLDQCHNGQCWCVDKWGREFDRSRSKGKINCQRFVI